MHTCWRAPRALSLCSRATQVAAHVRDALRMQKPLLVGAIGMGGPPSRTAALLDVVLGYLSRAGAQGMPVAGETFGSYASLCALQQVDLDIQQAT